MIIIAEINLIMHTSRIDEQITSNTDKQITVIFFETVKTVRQKPHSNLLNPPKYNNYKRKEG
jgi:hypothetical protein